MRDPRTELVEIGYDAIADRFLEWRDRIVGDPRLQWSDELVTMQEPAPDGLSDATFHWVLARR